MAKKTTSREKSDIQPEAAPVPAAKTAKPRARRPPKKAPVDGPPDSGEINRIVAAQAASDASVGSGVEAPLSPADDEIRLRAYHRYLERGGGHGLDFEDWLAAERELKQGR
ncbi:MAG: DUF2934 domain-containing protein [Vicinamibacterales bacterium]